MGSSKKSKATKLIDALMRISERKARIGTDKIEATEEEIEQIDEELFMAKSRLHYYIDSLNVKVRSLQQQLSGPREHKAFSAVRKTNELLDA